MLTISVIVFLECAVDVVVLVACLVVMSVNCLRVDVVDICVVMLVRSFINTVESVVFWFLVVITMASVVVYVASFTVVVTVASVVLTVVSVVVTVASVVVVCGQLSASSTA